MSRLLKICAGLTAVIGFIGGIAGGNMFKTISYSYTGRITESFNVVLMIVSWISCFILAVILFALGEILEYEMLNAEANQRILEKLSTPTTVKDGTAPATANPPSASTPKAVASRNPVHKKDRWECPKCGTFNEKARLFCKDCGADK